LGRFTAKRSCTNSGRDAPSVRRDNSHHIPDSHPLLCVPIARADRWRQNAGAAILRAPSRRLNRQILWSIGHCRNMRPLLGTFGTWAHIRLEAATRTKADIRCPLQVYGFTPWPTGRGKCAPDDKLRAIRHPSAIKRRLTPSLTCPTGCAATRSHAVSVSGCEALG
jgi:hypothetical protein